MKRVNIADLKNSLSRHLTHVRAGGDIIVLDRSTPVARIVPFDRVAHAKAGKAGGVDAYWTEDRLAELERNGIITQGGPATVAAWLKTERAIKLPKGAPSAVATLLQTRRESTR